MDIFTAILIIMGLVVFESINSIDNAVINAEVLTGVGTKARKWFLTWGMFFAVVVVRGLLPFLIVWATVPQLGIWDTITATFSSDPVVIDAIEHSAPMLLLGAGVFLLFLFLHWLFLEPKVFGLRTEKFFFANGVWFFAIASIILTTIVWQTMISDPLLAFGATIGSSAFFILNGFKQNAEKAEIELRSAKRSDVSKIIYLEMIDMAFSVDGVLGAFAFTLSIPLILIGNGIGAFVVRWMTISNIENIKKYVFLKHGAMYSIFFLGLIMIAHGFGIHIPEYVSPLITFFIIGIFFIKSRRQISLTIA
ncbi:MAG: hypothetical protein A2494_02825 [Candidatus Lloydbacteria bacterium RIFOXYC12_FULL_46_25]|uniref:DUF475 domain-containing protein n=1 Tax=Candidatus Lloydbacteria bacterium RIFOXYC12_FULL_46_25 TaxID=1798670 RepID=A0A1G2E257_9BACT|nr:MAG: hypothetical protein A2494_02825 [Candidatus Lloydbacteria bacterium RIFOXYC12_FULL_46_25]